MTVVPGLALRAAPWTITWRAFSPWAERGNLSLPMNRQFMDRPHDAQNIYLTETFTSTGETNWLPRTLAYTGSSASA